jgi:D-alanine-D-alanine ligase
VIGTRLRVAVVYNEPVLPADHPDAASEWDVVQMAGAVSTALESQGLEPRLLGAGPPLGKFVGQLMDPPPDVVFNLVEGFAGQSEGECHVTSIFELLGLPYTGSPVGTLALCLSKSRTKALLKGFGIPTAPFVLVEPGREIPEWTEPGPVIVKPDAEDGSLGIHQSSVVETADEIADRVERLRRDYGGSVLIEAYLPGSEFNVTVLQLPDGPHALPVSQVVYDPASGLRPIMTYAAKWDPTSLDDRSSKILCPAPITPGLELEIRSVAERSFHVTGCRDYARVDIRLDDFYRPTVIEVNPNPDISPGAGLARSVRVAGLDYAQTIAGIALWAHARRVRPSPGPTTSD